jgi:hypothetical protein
MAATHGGSAPGAFRRSQALEMPTAEGLVLAAIEGLAERSLSEETGSDFAAAEF